MKITLLALAVTLAAPAFAGGPTSTSPEPVPAAAPIADVHDWSGAYVGFGYGTTTGEMSYALNNTVYEFGSGRTPTIFAGYLIQRGRLVYGGELAYSRGNDTILTGYHENLEGILDLKAKVGFAANKTLFYGIAGYSSVDFNWDGPIQNGKGPNYGFGVDYAISDRITTGIEYLIRRTSGDVELPLETRTINSETLSLRVAFSF